MGNQNERYYRLDGESCHRECGGHYWFDGTRYAELMMGEWTLDDDGERFYDERLVSGDFDHYACDHCGSEIIDYE